MKQYKAYGTGGANALAGTPRAAAALFFERFPGKRKCNIIEGMQDGHFFTVSYGHASTGDWPYSAKDITRPTVATLPDTVPCNQ